MAIVIPSKNIFDFENYYKDNKITNVVYTTDNIKTKEEIDVNVFNSGKYIHSGNPITGDIINFESNEVLVTYRDVTPAYYNIYDYVTFNYCAYLKRKQSYSVNIDIFKKRGTYDYIDKVYGYDENETDEEKKYANVTVSINGTVTKGKVKYLLSDDTVTNETEDYTKTLIFNSVPEYTSSSSSLNITSSKLGSINTNNLRYDYDEPPTITQKTYTIPTEVTQKVYYPSYTNYYTTCKAENDDTLANKALELIASADNSYYLMETKEGLLIGDIGAECVKLATNEYYFDIDEKDYIKSIKRTDTTGEITVEVKNFVLYGEYERYEPTSYSISVNGDKTTFDIEELYNFECDNTNVSMVENELLQDTSVFVKENQNVSLKTFLSDNIIKQYKNGKELLTIMCDIDDYYDENGNKVIDKLNRVDSENNKIPMTFNLHDIVIPYVNKDTPFSIYTSGNAKAFEVVSLNFTYNGIVRQKLTLLEVLEEEINNG